MDLEWEDLQAAFLSTRSDREYYLDRETGEVVSFSGTDDEDEGEKGEELEGESNEDEENLRLEFENDPDRFAEITPISISERIEWMSSFIVTVKVKELQSLLPEALSGFQPDRNFDRILRKYPVERGRWIVFMENQAQEIIDAWIEENDIESDTPPPWRPKGRHRPPKKAASDE